MVSQVLQLQQVAKSSDGAVANSVWLYYVAPPAEFMGIQGGQIYRGTIGISFTRPGKHTKNEGKWPFIVDLPIEE